MSDAETSTTSSPTLSFVSLIEPDRSDGWHPILEASNQVVLYNSSSHALTVTSAQPLISPTTPSTPAHEVPVVPEQCPYCHRPMDHNPNILQERYQESSRVPNYFHLLAIANEIASRPASPSSDGPSRRSFSNDTMAEGYFAAFFREERRLGMGANGTVWLCAHVLDDNVLGHYAVKKIAVGNSHEYLMNTLREVRLLETLRHPNIVTYHHAWLETHRFSSFGEPVPTLFVLMQWAEGGSLDDFISKRQGNASSTLKSSPNASTEDLLSRSDRIRAFRSRKKDSISGAPASFSPKRETKAIHLLSGEELRSLFEDITTGLSFLHDRGILHLDLKPGNVLLTNEGGQLIPRAMLSDFGTSQDMLNTARTRSGNTGTLEYTAPETLNAMRSVDSKADMWSLGMILHKLLFFRLPYVNEDISNLEQEIRAYAGFSADADTTGAFVRRGLPPSILILLQSLLDKDPLKRPSCDRVLAAVKSGKYDPNIRPTSLKTMPVAKRAPPLTPMKIEEHVEVGLHRRHSSASERTIHERSPIGSPISTREKTPLLTLPSPPPPEDPADKDEEERSAHSALDTQLSRSFVMKICKSVMLIAKMVHLNHQCPYSRISTPVVALCITLAVLDTWSDNMLLSAGLAVAHVGAIGLLKESICSLRI